MSSRLNILQGYVSASLQLLDALSKRGIVVSGDAAPSNTLSAPVLELPEQSESDQAFHRELLSRSLGQSLIDEICKAYERHSVLWREELQAEWATTYTRLPCLETRSATLKILGDAYRANLWRGLKAMQSQILGLLDERIRKFRTDSEAAAYASSSDQTTDSDDDNVRGHRAEAVAILEAAYAYTTNITQAEKRRLAQATGLEPRQVVIWFQNRRNRKVKSRIEAAAPGASDKHGSPPGNPPRKRKVSCNDEARPRRPTTFVTPEKKVRLHDIPPPPMDRRLLSSGSTTSLGSSVDSRADSLLSDWAGTERYEKQRTASSESAATSFTSPSVCSSFGSTPAFEHCSTSIRMNARQASQSPGHGHGRPTLTRSEQEQAFAQRLLGPSAPYVHRQSPPVEIAHIFNDGEQYLTSSGTWRSSASNLLFPEDSDVPRLDFDDLGLSLADFGKDTSLPFDFAAPPPAGGARQWQRGASVVEGPTGLMHNQRPFAVTSTDAVQYRATTATLTHDQAAPRPHHHTDVAEALNQGDFDLFAALASLPTFQGMSAEAIVQFAASGDQDLPFEAGQMQYAPSPSTLGSSTSSSTPRGREVVTPPSRAAGATSPEDFAFTFDFAELGLDRTFEEIRQSYRVAEEEAKMYSISEAEDGESGGALSGWETGPEEVQGHQVKRFSSSTIVPYSATLSRTSSTPWAIPTRPVDLHAQRGQAGERFFGS